MVINCQLKVYEYFNYIFKILFNSQSISLCCLNFREELPVTVVPSFVLKNIKLFLDIVNGRTVLSVSYAEIKMIK